jgi:putative transposase
MCGSGLFELLSRSADVAAGDGKVAIVGSGLGSGYHTLPSTEHTTMTTQPTIALTDLVEKGADADLLRQMIQEVVERVMAFDVENLCNAGYGERSAERANSRNGYRERLWQTRAGAVNVKIPKLRSGSYFPPFLEPRRTAEKALAAVIQEAYVQGVSTRSVDELVKAMGMSGISKSQVWDSPASTDTVLS